MTPWFSNQYWLNYFCFEQNDMWYQLRFEKEKLYYSLCLEKDLLEDWTLSISQGQQFSKIGQRRLVAFSSYISAFEQLCHFIESRVKQRYSIAMLTTNNTLFILILNYLATQNTVLSQATYNSNTLASSRLINTKKRATSRSIKPKTVLIHEQLGLF